MNYIYIITEIIISEINVIKQKSNYCIKTYLLLHFLDKTITPHHF